jgi:hypothetical protein
MRQVVGKIYQACLHVTLALNGLVDKECIYRHVMCCCCPPPPPTPLVTPLLVTPHSWAHTCAARRSVRSWPVCCASSRRQHTSKPCVLHISSSSRRASPGSYCASTSSCCAGQSSREARGVERSSHQQQSWRQQHDKTGSSRQHTGCRSSRVLLGAVLSRCRRQR